jgi:hypothetical protein
MTTTDEISQNDIIDKDEVLKMARQAGIIAIHTEGDGHWHQQFIALEAFAKLVAAATASKEREACANLMLTLDLGGEESKAADAIRARRDAVTYGETTSRGET